ncbi:MAG: hypothetical protein V4573_13815 [Pseudomonadota bacterium]
MKFTRQIAATVCRTVAAEEVTVLDFRGNTSQVQRVAGAQILFSSEFALGVDSLVRQSLRHEPPRPVELEHAIESTEEAVMPLADRFAGSSMLILQGMGAALIASSLEAGGIAQTGLSLDQVEALFNRLVAVSEGRPASQESLPTHARFFAVVLMLREFMHHLHFAQVRLQPSPG